jgi:hypothetical protein
MKKFVQENRPPTQTQKVCNAYSGVSDLGDTQPKYALYQKIFEIFLENLKKWFCLKIDLKCVLGPE